MKLDFGEKEFNSKFQVNSGIPLWHILKLPINLSMLLGAGCTLSHGCLVLMWDCQKDQQSVTDSSAFKTTKKPTLFLSLPIQLMWQDNLFSVSCLIGAWRSNWAIGVVAFLYLFTHLCFSVTETALYLCDSEDHHDGSWLMTFCHPRAWASGLAWSWKQEVGRTCCLSERQRPPSAQQTFSWC